MYVCMYHVYLHIYIQTTPRCFLWAGQEQCSRISCHIIIRYLRIDSPLNHSRFEDYNDALLDGLVTDNQK